ncbi:MAG: SIR2 family protein [Comamonas sp.]
MIAITLANQAASKNMANGFAVRTAIDLPSSENAMSFLSENIKHIVHMRQRMSKDNRLGLCLGAGVSMDFNIPSWKVLIERIACDESVNGSDLLKVSESLTAQSQFLYQKYRQSLPSDDLNEDDVIKARRVQTGWLKLVHKCLYATAKIKDSDLKEHPYLWELAPLIKRSAMTINYNFDDTVERMLYCHNSEREIPTGEDKGFEVIWQPTAQFRRNQGVIYHPNGFLPLQTVDGLSEQVVFMEQEFADQLVDVGAGHYVSLLSHLAKHTIVFMGLSMSDANLKHLLRISARSNPGNFHYHVHWCGEVKPSTEEQDAIRKANFGVYNLVTLFLSTSEIKELARLLVADQDDFNAICDAEPHGTRTEYKYYLTGPVGTGKTTTLEQLKSIATFDEWVDRRNPLLGRPHSELSEGERADVDSWINQQFRKKNRRVSAASQIIAAIDRSPLDPLYFVKDDSAVANRALELLKWMVPPESSVKSIAAGHLIVLLCDPRVLVLRLAGRDKTYNIEQLISQIDTVKQMWESMGATIIDTTNLTSSQVVTKVLKVILFQPYSPIDFDQICKDKASGASA